MKYNNKIIPLVKNVGFSSNFHNINKLGLVKHMLLIVRLI